MSRLLFRDLLKAVRRRRRLLAGASAAAAVYCGMAALSPPPPPTVAVRDLAGGTPPTARDLRTVRLPAAVVPAGALQPGSDIARRVLAGPVRSGEALTDARFLTPASLPAGQFAYPVRIDDAELTTLLQVGDRIDLYAATSTPVDAATPLASAVRVIALPASASGVSGALVVIGAGRDVIGRIAQATANTRISFALTPDTS